MPLRIALLLSLLALPALAQSKSSDNDGRLKKALQRYPEADTNKDGVLTFQEARAYLQKIQTGNGTSVPSAKKTQRSNDPQIKPNFADLSYGSHPNDKLDLWCVKSDKSTPLVVFIHGGGFIGGDKSSASGLILKQCLDSGVSFAAINYRFRTEASINVVLRDCARAVQFLRYKAGEYNLDKTRIACYGGSAGAGTSLWLAFHPDLADPQNPDPVLRESTRILAAGANATQATYDILRWAEVVGEDAVKKYSDEADYAAFYGLKSPADLQSDEGKMLRADADMLGLISKDDPPVYLASGDTHDKLQNRGDYLHSPLHAQTVKKYCDQFGVPCIFAKGADKSHGSMTDFLLEHLGAKTSTGQ